ncbi:MAG: Uncharacterized protein XD78_0109 [Desulfotomaculum sp. 46_296]|nr:MAG: Uncharacterized protein XD78_0109 [Desulfotomaculum sp. 46_296]
MKLSYKNCRGQTFVFVLIITAAIFLIGGAALVMGSSVMKTATNEKKQSQAYYTAEAGVERVIAKALAEPDWAKTTLPESVSASVFENVAYPDSAQGNEIKNVTVDKTTNDYYYDLIITSEGSYRESRKIIEARVRFYKPVDFEKKIWTGTSATLLNCGTINSNVWSNGDITVQNDGTVVKGSIYATGNVHLYENASVGENIEAYGNITVEDNAVSCVAYNNPDSPNYLGGWIKSKNNITVDGGAPAVWGSAWAANTISDPGNAIKGEKHPSSDPGTIFQLDSFPILTIQQCQDTASYSYVGPKTFTSSDMSDINGIIFTDGDVTVSGDYTGVGVIVSSGNIHINGNIRRLNTDSCLTLVSFGNISLSNGCNPVEALIYTPNTCQISDGGNLAGAIVAGTITTDLNAAATLDPLMEEAANPITWNCKIISWKEIY